MKKFFLIIFICIASLGAALSQKNPVYCGFDYFIRMKKTHDQEWYRAYQSALTDWKQKRTDRGGGEGVYFVPVVFHIVYNSNEQNVPDSVVHSQMEVINEDYRRLNEDAALTREEFLPVAADCMIEFELADFDPDGNPTTGIIHHFTERTGFNLDFFAQENTLDEVKYDVTGGADGWDPEHYLNIWVCNIEVSFFGQIFGLSYPPSGLDNWPGGSSAPNPGDDGVIVHYTTVGRNNPQASADGTDDNNKGRTLTHEIGHYLGLRHTWGDELFADPCSEDDGMTDTPLCGMGDQYACDYEANSCSEGGGDLPDQLENYMDYTQDVCYNMFTQEQMSLMRFVLENQRLELLSGSALQTTEQDLIRFSIYPNPTADILVLNLAIDHQKCSYQIHNSLGQLVLSGIALSGELNLSTLASDVYTIRITNGSAVSTARFVKIQ
ncbi:MAG: zinc-dependent metalloprotease [Flavobacteriales bacterium]